MTRHEPHVDRCASIWLIRTMIDPDAVFDFASRDAPVPEEAIPFDAPGVELGHHNQHAEKNGCEGK